MDALDSKDRVKQGWLANDECGKEGEGSVRIWRLYRDRAQSPLLEHTCDRTHLPLSPFLYPCFPFPL